MEKEKVIRQAEYILYNYNLNKIELDNFEEDCIYSSPCSSTPGIQTSGYSDPTANAAIKLAQKNKHWFQLKGNTDKAKEYINLFKDNKLHTDIITLRYLQNKGIPEIKDTLNISFSTYYRQLQQIRLTIYNHIANKPSNFF